MTVRVKLASDQTGSNLTRRDTLVACDFEAQAHQLAALSSNPVSENLWASFKENAAQRRGIVSAPVAGMECFRTGIRERVAL
ncbi:MAG: hypothetical protein AAFQ82_07400 [Myxococcota bacterium]